MIPELSLMGSADTLLSWKIFRATTMGVSGEAWGGGEEIS